MSEYKDLIKYLNDNQIQHNIPNKSSIINRKQSTNITNRNSNNT